MLGMLQPNRERSFRETGRAFRERLRFETNCSSYNLSSPSDALAKAIYSRMFDFLIEKVNKALARDKLPHRTVIGVLDIFGFEIFETNGMI